MSGTSNHYDSMTALQSMIQGLSLSGMNSADIQIRPTPWHQKGDPLSHIVIAPFLMETTGDANSNEDMVGYVIAIAIYAQATAATEAATLAVLESVLGWRQKIRRKIRNNSFASLPRSYQMVPRLFNVVELGEWDKGILMSAMAVEIQFEEPRS